MRIIFLKEIEFDILQLEQKNDYLVYFGEHQLGRAFIFYEVIDITFKYKKIVGWIVIVEEQLMKLNLGSE